MRPTPQGKKGSITSRMQCHHHVRHEACPLLPGCMFLAHQVPQFLACTLNNERVRVVIGNRVVEVEQRQETTSCLSGHFVLKSLDGKPTFRGVRPVEKEARGAASKTQSQEQMLMM